jgi:hypothetical protein
MSPAARPIPLPEQDLARELSLRGVRPGAGKAGGEGDGILVMLTFPPERSHTVPALPGDFAAALRAVEAEIYDAR